MAALNVAEAWRGAVERDFAQRRYDLTVTLDEFQPVDDLRRILAGVPAVRHAEFWPGASPYLVGPDGVSTVTVSLVGPDPGSRLLTLPLVAGRWLEPDDVDGVVINNTVVANHPGLGVGDRVGVRTNGRTTTFPIVGIVRELAPMPVIYAPPGAVRGVTGRAAGAARASRVVTQGHDDDAQRAAGRAIEAAFEREGIAVSGMHRMLDMKQSILDHLVIILSILTMASTIVVIVGAIGLASTLTVSVVQRTREIGILAAIGATPRTIAGQVAVEGVLLGLFSWLVALLFSIPLSYALGTTCGRIFLRTPLDFHLSPAGRGDVAGPRPRALADLQLRSGPPRHAPVRARGAGGLVKPATPRRLVMIVRLLACAVLGSPPPRPPLPHPQARRRQAQAPAWPVTAGPRRLPARWGASGWRRSRPATRRCARSSTAS